MIRLNSLLVFLSMVLIAAIISSQFAGGQWYQSVSQPDWNPPALVMAMVWPILYVLMALSAWIVWENRRGAALVALVWWLFQLLLGIAWSAVFFGLERLGWALAVMSLWVIASWIVVNAFRFVTTAASVLMLPVAIWLVFSWVLNLTQWHLNGGGSG